MSLSVVSSSATRHLRHQLLSVTGAKSLRIGSSGGNNTTVTLTRRQFSSAKGGGLRRTQPKGRRSATAPKSTQSNNASSTTGSTTAAPPSSQRPSDPHSIANEMVSSAITAEGRTPGTESVATLTKEQKLSNFAMAGGLLAFVSYIFYYSLASVGGGQSVKMLLFGADDTQQTSGGEDGEVVNPGFEEFLKEANEGRTLEERRQRAEKEARGEARDLAELESSTAARLKAEGVGEDVIVAGSANEEEEREMARVAGFVVGDEAGDEAVVKKRPLWKRVVFFWRRE